MNTETIQQALVAAGYDIAVDGIAGPQTIDALRDFQEQRGFELDFGADTGAALQKEIDAPSAPDAGGDGAQLVPESWMPACSMQRVIAHWTAGNWSASDSDRQHYHILIEDDGTLVRGTPPINANAAPLSDNYAAHTKDCNTGSIGVALCGMVGAVESPYSPGKAPLTAKQWDALAIAIADLCRRYSIVVTPQTVLSHAEVQATLGIAQAGKWDIAVLPFDPALNTAKECGDDLRRRVAALV